MSPSRLPERVALVHDHLNQVGGAEKVLEVFHELFSDAPVYTLVHDPELTHRRFADWDIRSSFIERLPGGRRHFKWYLPLMPRAFERFDLSEYDLVLSDSSAFSKGVITRPGTLHVSYCHTPTRYLWSDRDTYVRELNTNWLVKRTLPILQRRLRHWDALAADRVNRFIANSHFVAGRIFNYYQRESTVIYPPVDVEQLQQHQPTTGEAYLLVARFRPYKRVDLAIRAANQHGARLDIIGSGEDEARLRKLAGPTVRFLGRVADIGEHLASCRAFINPQEEDFGIAAVEAMASGKPVIAYRAGGAKEIIQEGETGVFFDRQEPEALVAAMRRFESMTFDPERIQQAAQRFSRERFITELSTYLEGAWEAFRKQSHS